MEDIDSLLNQYVSEGNWKKTLETCEELLEAHPHNASLHYNRGVAYINLGEWIKAVRSLRRSLQLRPGSPGCLIALGAALLHAGMRHDAIDVFQGAVRIGCEEPWVFLRLSQLLIEDGVVENDELLIKSALATLHEATRKWPENDRLYYMLANVFAQLDQREDALTSIRNCVNLRPEDSNYWAFFAKLLQKRGDKCAAIDAYKTASAIDPNNQEARLGLVYALLSIQKWEEAHEEVSKIVPDDSRILKSLKYSAYALTQLGRFDDAADKVAKALMIAPEDQDLKRLEKSIAFRRQIDLRPSE